MLDCFSASISNPNHQLGYLRAGEAVIFCRCSPAAQKPVGNAPALEVWLGSKLLLPCRVAANAAENEMDAHALAMSVAPCLAWLPPPHHERRRVSAKTAND